MSINFGSRPPESAATAPRLQQRLYHTTFRMTAIR